jgi:endonuclease VIII
MPEGDAVWRTARRLDAALSGRVLTLSDFRVPRFATASLVGQRVVEVAPRGKHLLARTDAGLTLHTHMQMDGRWTTGPVGRSSRAGPWHEIRIRLANDLNEAVGYRLPVVELVRTTDEDRLVGHLGPDLLGPDWDPERAVKNIESAPNRSVGEALLDQRNLAGIGTIYRAEACYVAGVSPWSAVRDVDGLHALVEIAQRQLVTGARDPRGGTRGDPRGRHWVYGRAGLPCRRCGTRIKSAELGPTGSERIVAWCPRCQPDTVGRSA